MKWEHKCSLDWLKKRQRFLTASEIKSLLPVTKTGRPRVVGEQEYLKVMAGKMMELTEEDCYSYGPMARGHLLEPYAIEALNRMLKEMQGEEHETFHWWDDEIVSLAGKGRVIAFSPDAMDIPMGNPARIPHAIAEVKSYTAERHIQVAYSPKELIEERWQIATAMALLESIDHGYLVLFNPKMKFRKTFVIRFDRSELEKEIGMILDVEEKWMEFRETGPIMHRPPSGGVWSPYGGNEETIEKEIERRQRLNPVV